MTVLDQEPERSDLQNWMARQYSLSAKAMMGAVSAVDLIKERKGFGRYVRPAKGSVLASPVIAAYDPDPDYFFHWQRDSAVVVEALGGLIAGAAIPEAEGLVHFRDFLAFSLKLAALDGCAFLEDAGDFRARVEPFFLRYVRPDNELRAITGDTVLGEPRFDPDGSLDILKWSRPQHDGPALRALVVLRFCSSAAANDPDALALARALVSRDLAFTLKNWRKPSFDIWEEELGRHYYTQLVQCEALAQGARWLEGEGETELARACREASQAIEAGLTDFWSDAGGFYKSRIGSAGDKDLDIATLLAVIHARRERGEHSVKDPKIAATAAQLEQLFAELYQINQPPRQGRAPAMGRYRGDKYYSGGAYYFSTLGTAEFYFRTAQNSSSRREAEPLLLRGDMFMATVAAFAPSDGDLAEQFDQTTGAQTSAKSLAWSHAAFINAYVARAEALRALGAKGGTP